jgi:hypothetical protein
MLKGGNKYKEGKEKGLRTRYSLLKVYLSFFFITLIEIAYNSL